GSNWQGKEPWPQRMHAIIVEALRKLGVTANVTSVPTRPFEGALCFQHVTSGDVMINNSKIVGSAQRRRKGALLQHGSILMSLSPFAPALPGIQELSGHNLPVERIDATVAAEFGSQTGWTVEPAEWTDAERQRIDDLTEGKYGQDSWNRKR